MTAGSPNQNRQNRAFTTQSAAVPARDRGKVVLRAPGGFGGLDEVAAIGAPVTERARRSPPHADAARRAGGARRVVPGQVGIGLGAGSGRRGQILMRGGSGRGREKWMGN